MPPVKKVAAAKAETNGHHPVIEWRGLEFQGPVKLPGTIAFDLSEAAADENIGGLFKVLRGILGPEQMGQVRQKLVEDDVALEDAFEMMFGDLVGAVVAPYGLTPGES